MTHPSFKNQARTARATAAELLQAHPYPPLEAITRPMVPTHQASYYLDRRPQTLRSWACLERGPLRAVRINGRLAWPVSEIRRLMGVS